MLTSLGLANLKCFDALHLNLGRLTLLTGFNAAGKSSSYQPLLLLTQGMRSAPRLGFLSLNGPLVRLGTAGELLSTSGTDRVGIEINTAEARSKWIFVPAERSGGSALALEEGTIDVNGEPPIQWAGSLVPGIPASEKHDQFFASIRQVVYLGAVRLGAAEAFPTPEDAGISHADVGSRGEYAPWWYAQYVDEEIEEARRHRDEPGLTLRRQLDRFLSDLFPGGQANAELIARTSLVRLGLRNDLGSDWRRPINTGYGITYAFPVLVALLLAKPGQLIIIDSPEAHLHPRGQSLIGQLLAHFAAAGVQIMVETHSEHVLNGIRIAVRNRVISAYDVALYFFNFPKDSKTEQRVSNLRVDDAGNIHFWPAGFFDQSEHDLSKLAGWE